MPRSHPPEVREYALKLARKGKSVVEVAAAIGISKSTAFDWLRDAGLARGRPGRAERKAALALLRSGVGCAEVGRRLGVPKPTVWVWLRAAQLGPVEPPATQVDSNVLAERRQKLQAELASMEASEPCRCGLRGEHVCLPESASQLQVAPDGGGWLAEGCSRRGVGHR